MRLSHFIPFSILSFVALCGCQWFANEPNEEITVQPKPYIITPLNERAPKATVELHRPFDFPLFLSGNFGELRSNHFHGGIDFKTQGTTGHPIHCAADGYVSQISVSGGGYGRAIYVTHPAIGLTTVYAHIERFVPMIDSLVSARQYELETFAITMRFNANQLPVKKGEIIAYSGNSGYSFGPHLHMEVRHTATGDALDPLPYFKTLMNDDVAPVAHSISLYPDKQRGCVNGTKNPAHFTCQSGAICNFSAWGKVYPAVRANDYMTDSHNVYGVKFLSLKVDGQEVYRRTIDRFRTGATRAINTLVDYAYLNNTGNWNMHTRVPQSQPLGVMIETTLADGAIDINEERAYNCAFVMTDDYGNTATVPFVINGTKCDIASVAPKGKLIKYNSNDTITLAGLKLKFYEGCFYEDVIVDVSSNVTDSYFSPIYNIGDNATPIARAYRLSLKIENDTIADKTKYCIARITPSGGKIAVNSRYNEGEMIGYVSRFGSYAVTIDSVAPKISPINQSSWSSNGVITYRITDDFSGIKNYRGTIDGKWVMFEADNKNSIITYHLDNRSKKGTTHQINIIVTDNCGNSTTLKSNVDW